MRLRDLCWEIPFLNLNNKCCSDKKHWVREQRDIYVTLWGMKWDFMITVY